MSEGAYQHDNGGDWSRWCHRPHLHRMNNAIPERLWWSTCDAHSVVYSYVRTDYLVSTSCINNCLPPWRDSHVKKSPFKSQLVLAHIPSHAQEIDKNLMGIIYIIYRYTPSIKIQDQCCSMLCRLPPTAVWKRLQKKVAWVASGGGPFLSYLCRPFICLNRQIAAGKDNVCNLWHKGLMLTLILINGPPISGNFWINTLLQFGNKHD